MGICISPTDCVTEVVDSVWSGFADSVHQATGQMIATLFTWWTATESTSVDSAVMHTAQRFVTSWVALPVAVLALVSVVAWGVASGGEHWVKDVVRGLLVFGIAAAGSIAIVARLQAWSASLAAGILAAVPTGDIGDRFTGMLDTAGTSPVGIIFWQGLIFGISAVQYLLMLFRDGAVLLLTLVVPLAAAGQFSRPSSRWLPKITGWLLAFIFMKPAAALVYYLGLSLLGKADGLQALATGACLMVAAIVALPAMLRLVTFAVDSAPLHTNALAATATVTGIAASASQVVSRRTSSSAPAAAAAAPAGAAAAPAGAALAAVSAASNITRRAASVADPARVPGGVS